RRRLAALGVVACEDASVAHEDGGAVPLAGRDALSGDDPGCVGVEGVGEDPRITRVTGEQGGDLLHDLSPYLRGRTAGASSARASLNSHRGCIVLRGRALRGGWRSSDVRVREG